MTKVLDVQHALLAGGCDNGKSGADAGYTRWTGVDCDAAKRLAVSPSETVPAKIRDGLPIAARSAGDETPWRGRLVRREPLSIALHHLH